MVYSLLLGSSNNPDCGVHSGWRLPDEWLQLAKEDGALERFHRGLKHIKHAIGDISTCWLWPATRLFQILHLVWSRILSLLFSTNLPNIPTCWDLLAVSLPQWLQWLKNNTRSCRNTQSIHTVCCRHGSSIGLHNRSFQHNAAVHYCLRRSCQL